MKIIYFALIVLAFAMPAMAQEKAETKKHEPNVDIWLPPEFQSSEDKWPLIVFSHSFGGCANESKFLTSYLADNGYIVIAPDHADADCKKSYNSAHSGLKDLRVGQSGRPEKSFRYPDKWNTDTEKDRADDVLFAISSMLDDRMYKNYIDTNKIALIGYDLGGYAALGMAGGWKDWRDNKIKAVLALSPYADPFIANHGLGRIAIPVMFQSGTKDIGLFPSSQNQKTTAYNQIISDKYYIEWNGARHESWTDKDKNFHEMIQKTSLQFFDKYLKDGGDDIDYKLGKNQIKVFLKNEGKAAP